MPVDILADVKVALLFTGDEDDALLTELQAAARAFIEEHCGRSFSGGTRVELHAGGQQLLFLRDYPLLSVASVKVDVTGAFEAESVRAASSYIVHAERGVIENRDGPFVPVLSGWVLGPDHFPASVRVEYTTATSAVPAPVQRAEFELIGHWYRHAKTMAATEHQNLLEKTQEGTTTTYPWNQSVGFRLPEGVFQLLRPFRVPRM